MENRKLQRTLNKLKEEKLKKTNDTNKKKLSMKENSNNNSNKINQTKTSNKTKRNNAVKAKRNEKIWKTMNYLYQACKESITLLIMSL